MIRQPQIDHHRTRREVAGLRHCLEGFVGVPGHPQPFGIEMVTATAGGIVPDRAFEFLSRLLPCPLANNLMPSQRDMGI